MDNENGQAWDDNVQFTRLLAEVAAVADLTVEQIDAVAESMDLEASEVHTLFVRAEHEFEALKDKEMNLEDNDYTSYLEGGGNHCLHCRSDNIEGSMVEMDDNNAAQEIVCNGCGSTWRDIYTLVCVDNVEVRDEV